MPIVVLSLLAGALLLFSGCAREKRVLRIEVPASAGPHEPVKVVVGARSRVGGGEQVGFLQVEGSVDGGKTWVGLCYDQNLGSNAVRLLGITTGEVGVKTLVRARAAYRDGEAGDVDFKGGAIQWEGTWAGWAEPPACAVAIEVRAP